jgi:DNA-binding NtrC family response regulator
MHTIATLTARAASVLQRRALLTAAGYRVITPRRPEQILELLSSESCSALVVNSSVPGPRRTTILKKLRETHPDLPIIHIQEGAMGSPEPLADVNINIDRYHELPLVLEKLARDRRPEPGQNLNL